MSLHRGFFALFLLALLGVLGVGGVAAFPGDAEDEACAQLRAQAQSNGTPAPTCLTQMGLSATELRAASIESALYPVPNVRQVVTDEAIVFARKYRKVNAGATIYDAPNGNPIRTVGEGLNLMSYIGLIEGWVQLRQNEWVPIDQTRAYEISVFAGVEIDAPLERPFAWMLVPVQPSLMPGGLPHAGYAEIPRYQLLNIHAIEVVDGWEWYMVGESQWIQQLRVSKVKPVARPAEIGLADRWFAVDLYEQTMVAYEGDRMVFATLISSGLPQWSTQEGLFRIYQRWLYGPMSGAAGYLGDAYSIENIPHIMYFNGDMALHAAYWHDKFGYRQSRGCVNLSLMDAYWAYEWTREPQYNTAWVYVYSSNVYRSDLPDWAVRPRN
jgi:hypothetical protein